MERYPEGKVFLPLKDTLIGINMLENHLNVFIAIIYGRLISLKSV